MKLAILGTRGIPARYGGFETFAEELSTRLVERGHEVTVYCEKGGHSAPDSYHGVRLEYVSAPSFGPLSIVWFDTLCMVKAARSHDVLYLLGYGAGAFVWLPRLLGAPVWVNMDGLEWKRSKWPWYGRWYLRFNEWCATRFSSGMIADAVGIESYLRQKHGPQNRIEMIPYGAGIIEFSPDPGLLDSFQLSPQGYYLVVCRLEPENHVAEIVEGFNNAGTARDLVIVGNSDSESHYVRELKKKSGDRVRYVGVCYEKTKLTALRYHAYAYFHGHSVGGTNPSLLEALGCGNIVIAHDNVFNREVTGEAGFYFMKSGDIPQLLDRIENMGDVLREKWSARARQLIRDRYTWDRVTEKYLQIFHD